MIGKEVDINEWRDLSKRGRFPRSFFYFTLFFFAFTLFFPHFLENLLIVCRKNWLKLETSVRNVVTVVGKLQHSFVFQKKEKKKRKKKTSDCARASKQDAIVPLACTLEIWTQLDESTTLLVICPWFMYKLQGLAALANNADTQCPSVQISVFRFSWVIRVYAKFAKLFRDEVSTSPCY